jgi:hypothetical protein
VVRVHGAAALGTEVACVRVEQLSMALEHSSRGAEFAARHIRHSGTIAKTCLASKYRVSGAIGPHDGDDNWPFDGCERRHSGLSTRGRRPHGPFRRVSRRGVDGPACATCPRTR